MKVAARLLAAAVLVAGAASCASLIGLEPFEGSGGAGAAGTSDTGGATSTGGGGPGASTGAAGGGSGACDDACLAPVRDWMGPFLLEDGAGCAVGAPAAELQRPPTACPDCPCTAIAGCSVSVADFGVDHDCKNPVGSPTPLGEGCSNLGTPSMIDHKIVTIVTAPGVCMLPVSSCLPPASEHVTLCRPPETCGRGGVCAAKGAKVCVYGDAGASCPAGFGGSDEVLYQGVEILNCTCGGSPPSGSDCTPRKLAFDKLGDCTGSSMSVTAGVCVEQSGPGLEYVPLNQGTCGSSVATNNSGPVRVCCAP